MTRILASALLAFCLTGCVRSVTRQGDQSTTTHTFHLDERGRTNAVTVTETRQTTTRASATAAISSSQAIKGLKATQDGKKQGLEVAEAAQKSDVDKLIDGFTKVAPLLGTLYGIPVGGGAQGGQQLAAPAGFKWVLKPKDDPSQPQTETEPQ